MDRLPQLGAGAADGAEQQVLQRQGVFEAEREVVQDVHRWVSTRGG